MTWFLVYGLMILVIYLSCKIITLHERLDEAMNESNRLELELERVK